MPARTNRDGRSHDPAARAGALRISVTAPGVSDEAAGVILAAIEGADPLLLGTE